MNSQDLYFPLFQFVLFRGRYRERIALGVRSFTKKFIFEMPGIVAPRLVEDVKFTLALKILPKLLKLKRSRTAGSGC